MWILPTSAWKLAALAVTASAVQPTTHFRADLRNTTAAIIPGTAFESISSFTWIGNWESLDPAAVARLNISARYPFLRYAELFTATGGCAEGFVDAARNKTCAPWLLFDAPRAADGTYSWARLLRAVDNVRAAGLLPYIVTGNVPVAMSPRASLGGFGVNTRLPANLTEYSAYIRSFAEAALARYGAGELRHWRWGVLTEYNNPSWFDDGGAAGYARLYDFTVCGLRAALAGAGAMGAVGAHACTTCGAPGYTSGWDAQALIEHVTTGTDACTGATGVPFDFWSNSFYAAVPEGSDPGHIPPWSIGNFEGVMRPMRAALDGAGLAHVPLGIDEGRILAGPGGSPELGGARAVGSAYQAAFDALLFKKMLDVGVSWYSRWAVNTNGQSIGSAAPSLDSASTQTARLAHRLAGHRRVPVLGRGGGWAWTGAGTGSGAGGEGGPPTHCAGCAPTAYDARLCQCGCAGARASACCCEGGVPRPCIDCAAGPLPGPQLQHASLVEAVAGVTEGEAGAVTAIRVLLVHFSGDLNATASADVEFELCGLPHAGPSNGPGNGPSNGAGGAPRALAVTTWVVDEAHGTFWAEWQQDLAAHEARNTSAAWPAGVSRWDETAPAAVHGRPGWEWVASLWPKYEALAVLAPTSSASPITVSATGCATLRAVLAPHSVVLWEIA
eukprot:g3902.t1